MQEHSTRIYKEKRGTYFKEILDAEASEVEWMSRCVVELQKCIPQALFRLFEIENNKPIKDIEARGQGGNKAVEVMRGHAPENILPRARYWPFECVALHGPNADASVADVHRFYVLHGRSITLALFSSPERSVM